MCEKLVIEVTPEMLAAGERALLLSCYGNEFIVVPDSQVVREILVAALATRENALHSETIT